MCIFWRFQGGTAEFYTADDPEATEVMLDDYAEYFRSGGTTAAFRRRNERKWLKAGW
jgi:hypothetical protein